MNAKTFIVDCIRWVSVEGSKNLNVHNISILVDEFIHNRSASNGPVGSSLCIIFNLDDFCYFRLSIDDQSRNCINLLCQSWRSSLIVFDTTSRCVASLSTSDVTSQLFNPKQRGVSFETTLIERFEPNVTSTPFGISNHKTRHRDRLLPTADQINIE